MSGPKVVRIVTREEIRATCRGQLARVDAALAEWTRICARNGCADENALTEARHRRDALEALLQADRFVDLQKQATLEEAFLREDVQRRLAEVLSEKAAARKRERRQHEAASALLKSLAAAGVAVDPELRAGLERGEAAAISQGLLLLAPSGSKDRADAALAAKLRDDTPARSFDAWVLSHALSAEHTAIERIEARIAAIVQIATHPRQAEWQARLAEAATAPAARQRLVVDSLEVETGRELTLARQISDARSRLELCLAEARAAGLPLPELPEGLSCAELEERRSTIEASLAAHREAGAVADRRAAVLEGLSGLGYEVSEGMVTAWASEGRLVVRSAGRPDYGVELSGVDRFQMKPVAFARADGGPDAARDRDAEVIWCGDVSELERRLSTSGGGLVIEKSLPVGAVPLKRIAVASASAEAMQDAPLRKERQLR